MKTGKTHNSGIIINNIVKKFYEKKCEIIALNSINLNIPEGSFFGLLGPNGAGKTTLINILCGITTYDSGTIKFHDSYDIDKNIINLSSAYNSLPQDLTTYQNLKFFALLYGIKNYQSRIEEIVEIFKINSLLQKRVRSLSSGQKTLVGICKSLINNPRILFLDECTIGLDPDAALCTRQALKAYHNNHKPTIIFTSHYLAEIEFLCDNVAFIMNGKIIKYGDINFIKKDSAFIKMNITVSSFNKEFFELIKSRIIEENNSNFTLLFEEDKFHKEFNEILHSDVIFDDINIIKPTLEDIFLEIIKDVNV